MIAPPAIAPSTVPPSTPPSPRAESPTQRAERLKREQNPWEELPRLFAAMRGGIGAIAPADLNSRLRWWGLYTQGDGQGAFGGAAPYFMMRIRLPNGLLTAAQLRTLAAVTRRYARGVADLTVRQNVQLHWLDAETLPDIFHELADVGLTSKSACGDDPRNITGCPLAGADADEYVDASPLVLALNRALIDTGDFYNLPRKFKVCITGCRLWCPHPEINDLSFTAHRRDGELGFGVRVGGGLSTTPVLARPLPVRLTWDEVVPVGCAVATLFREREELRQNRARARLKFLFLEHGWTVERFQRELEAILGDRLRPGLPDEPPPADFRDHLGIHPEHAPGLFYAGMSVLRGRVDADQLEAVAEAAAHCGSGEVRVTAMQNLVVVHVPGDNLEALRHRLLRARLPLQASVFRRGVVSCTGKEFCKLAVTETKSFAAELVAELERRLPAFPEPLRINLNGCPNSCGQHWVADVGLQGTRVKTPAGPADGFDVFLGGGLGAGARLAHRLLGRVLATDLPARLESLCRFYLAERVADECFRDFVRRQSDECLSQVLGRLPAAPMVIRGHDDLVPLEVE